MSLMEIAVLVLLVAILMQVYILDERVKRFRTKFDQLNEQWLKVHDISSEDLKEEQ